MKDCHEDHLPHLLRAGARQPTQIQTDVGVCASCNEAFSISDLVVSGEALDDCNLAEPPRGVWFVDEGMGWTLGSTTRSGLAWFLLPFMCVWSGITLGGIYGTQIAKGEFNLFLSLFGLPFLLGTLFMGSQVLMSLGGKTTISVEGTAGRIFVGVGSLGWTRRFDWAAIMRIDEDMANIQKSGSSNLVIALVGPTRLQFGSLLSDERRDFLLFALHRLLAARKLQGG